MTRQHSAKIVGCITLCAIRSSHRVGAGGYPPSAPLRTVHETFASHSSSLSKARLVRAGPLLDGIRGVTNTHRMPLGQLGNTDLWPLALRSCRRQFRDAPSDGRRSSFAFPDLRRFHMLSRHSTPDRRGHIRSITDRPWLLRPSQCGAFCPALRLG